jgi:O-antigen/teichoic acid export membrane protein
MRLISKAIWSVAASGTTIIGGFVQGIIIARFLGPDGTGRIGYLLWIVSMFSLVAGCGMYHSATKFVAEASARSFDDGSAMIGFFAHRLTLIALLATGLHVALLKFTLAKASDVELLLSSAYLLTSQFSSLYLSIALGLQRFRSVAVVAAISTALQLATALLAVSCWGVPGALAALIAGQLPGCFLALTFITAKPPRLVERATARLIWRYALPVWIAAFLASLAWSRSEVFFLERYCDNARVAFFTTGLTIASLGTQFPQLLMNSLFPHFSALAAKGIDGLGQTTDQCLRLAAWAIIPGSVIVAAGAPVWVVMFFGQRFVPSGPSASILTLLAGMMLLSPLVQYLQARNRSDLILVQTFVGGLIGVAGCFGLVPLWGIWGALIARTVAHISGNGILIVNYRRLSGHAFPVVQLVKIILVALCTSLPLAYVSYLGGANRWVAIGATIVAGIGYIIGTKVFDLLSAELVEPIAGWVRGLPPHVSVIPNRLLTWMTAKTAI